MDPNDSVVVELDLVDAEGTPFPWVTHRGARLYVVPPQQPFAIRYVVARAPGTPDWGATVLLDGVRLEAVQPLRAVGSQTVLVPGYPVWTNGTLSYRTFVFASSRVAPDPAVPAAPQLGPPQPRVGSVCVEVATAAFAATTEPVTYSSEAHAAQVKAHSGGDSKKFFETPALSAAPGPRVEAHIPRAGMRLHATGVLVAARTIHYDSALNLELRGVLTRPQHNHLLPPEHAYEAPRRVKREAEPQPLSEWVETTTIDLCDEDNVVVTTARKKRASLAIDGDE